MCVCVCLGKRIFQSVTFILKWWKFIVSFFNVFLILCLTHTHTHIFYLTPLSYALSSRTHRTRSLSLPSPFECSIMTRKNFFNENSSVVNVCLNRAVHIFLFSPKKTCVLCHCATHFAIQLFTFWYLQNFVRRSHTKSKRTRMVWKYLEERWRKRRGNDSLKVSTLVIYSLNTCLKWVHHFNLVQVPAPIIYYHTIFLVRIPRYWNNSFCRPQF